ncbi:MAG: glutamine-hydrolyzing carbamoyl-phosphate synthase small subunit [Akkermansia sp.]|nr:glutamine-hydrolyzing carbamoyl-phosphate synthase small subunit [Akkermansia sp.]
MNAILALEDGTIFEGKSFGATGTAVGEACFDTNVVGYQEAMTDPAYRGTVLAFTYTQIGNYGVCGEDNESDCPHVRAIVAGELARLHCNWRADEPMEPWMQRHAIPGIQGVDTRRLVKVLRTKGALRACVTTELDAAAAVKAAQECAPLAGSNLVAEVSTAAPYHWEGESRIWKLPNKTAGDLSNYYELGPVQHKVVAYDFGITRNLLRCLRRDGCDVTVVPATTPAEEVLALKPDGVLLSNGPGDPAALTSVHAEIKKLVGRVPVYAVGLGCQLLAHAFGGKTVKLHTSHRGGGHSVKAVQGGKVYITAQSHAFAVDADALPAELEVTHVNMNDGSVEGIRHKTQPALGVEFDPEGAPDAEGKPCYFPEFLQLIRNAKK